MVAKFFRIPFYFVFIENQLYEDHLQIIFRVDNKLNNSNDIKIRQCNCYLTLNFRFFREFANKAIIAI